MMLVSRSQNTQQLLPYTVQEKRATPIMVALSFSHHAPISVPPILLCYLLLWTLHLPHATSLSFNFDHFSKNDAATIRLDGDAFFNPDAQWIELTKNGASQALDNSLGRAAYAQPVPIWDDATGELASFTTTFSFQIILRGEIVSGDGMAFFLGHYPSSIPTLSGGGNLGLFTLGANSTNARGESRAVAVEFDTFMNTDYDTSDNHMGIDINSLVSSAHTNTSSVPGQNLTSGLVMTCRVSYDNSTQRLAADLQIGDTPYHVNAIADLRQLLPSVVAIGFSGATGAATEQHRLLAWSFNSTLDTPSGVPPVTSPSIPPPAPSWNRPLVPSPTSKPKSPSKMAGPISGGAAAVVAVAALAAGVVYVRLRRKRSKKKLEYETPAQIPRRFGYHELAEATHNFSEERKLGEGGYSVVYRGELMRPSRSVAIKKFKPGTSAALGRIAFADEIKVISRVRQRNLVELVGWCNDGNKDRLLLVYELATEGSLHEHLHQGRSWLLWRTRYNIILDLGRALRYLHDDGVLHGDIKPCNILLDSRHVAKLADFGLARFIEHGVELKTTRNVAGTPGYVDPEFVATGRRSRESDVYSFGIVLLEIVSGRRPAVVDHQTMVTPLLIWVWGKHHGNAILEAVDATLRDESTADDQGQMERLLLVGLWCAHPDPTQRPPIAEATRAIESRDAEIPPLPPPVFMATPSSFVADDRSRASDNSDADGGVSWTRSRDYPLWTR
ncbi:hypothetical protein ACP70R_004616 [Stipagrostis hirtigluma subsp. patula]